MFSKSEYVLKRNDAEVRHRHHSESNEFSVRLFWTHLSADIVAEAFSLVRRSLFFEPGSDRIVVVSARVNYTVLDMVVRCVGIVGEVPSESKEKHLHTRQLEVIDKFADIRGYCAEVFGYYREVGEVSTERVEEVSPWSLYPPAFDCGLCDGWYLPELHEPAEMVYPNYVEEGEIMSEASEPPLIACFRVGVPSVNRVTPELTRFAEVVGRDACQDGWFTGLVEFEKLWMCPYISAVVCHINR